MKKTLFHLTIFLCISTCVLTFNVSMLFYKFSFEGKLHEKWILESVYDSYFITCLQNCSHNSDCTGLAIQNFIEEENFTRTCHTLSKVDINDCDEEECDGEGFQIFQLDEPPPTKSTDELVGAPYNGF
ncbi:uncharacterized protein LOC118189754 [Stegodyphus dumicola]|uniref:uncharacterized protein LOC118189754 n=1 Tax=Stegodyphus dumicola TaxID=202533 RepID=UPI0015B1A7D2|nr:uncharacterized protein LOC118189754 [Stegodyphus dumicola]